MSALLGSSRAARVLALLVGISGLAATPARAFPLLSEVLYDASGSDNGMLFVELFGTPGTVLDGLVLEGVNGANGDIGPSVLLLGEIPADGLFVVADDAGDGSTSIPGADLIANFDFQNGPDSIRLVDGMDVLDAVGYGVFGDADIFAGEGLPAPDPSAGSSVARRFANVDSDDNAADFVVLDLPTPGAAPILDVAEPPIGLLAIAGLSALAGIRGTRRRGRSSPLHG